MFEFRFNAFRLMARIFRGKKKTISANFYDLSRKNVQLKDFDKIFTIVETFGHCNSRKHLKMLTYRQDIKGNIPFLRSKIRYFYEFFSPSKTISNYNIKQLLSNTVCIHF